VEEVGVFDIVMDWKSVEAVGVFDIVMDWK
jgi:hypothetical protein